jgi:hypothetical protein
MALRDLDRWLAEKKMNGHWSRDTNATQMKPYLARGVRTAMRTHLIRTVFFFL